MKPQPPRPAMSHSQLVSRLNGDDYEAQRAKLRASKSGRMASDLVEVIGEAVGEALLKQKTVVDGLRARIEALEVRTSTPSVKWAGIWRDGSKYTEGDLATDGGALWLAACGTRSRPGRGNDWTLICKRGSHG